MKLAFCGLGLMGGQMVRQLLAAGHQVNVWNRTQAKAQALVSSGAHVCETPAQAAHEADGALICLMDTSAVEQVVFGPHGIVHARGLKWLLDHSSIPPDVTRQLSARLKTQADADWLDAPVSGGVTGVINGTLTVMLGGHTSHMDAAMGAMRSYATNITHMGDSGTGQATKLCNQTIVAATVAAIAEAIVLAHRNGIDLSKLTQALTGGWADSKPLQVFAPRMIEPTSHSIGALSTMLKDLDTVMACAQTSGTPMPVTASVQQQLRIAKAAGLGEAELSALISLIWPEKRQAFLQQL